MGSDEFLKWTTSDVDFYELLGVTFNPSPDSDAFKAELRRAYRKTALKYHPDKAGKDYDPDKYELFQAANEVLSDAALKEKYDNHRNAKLQRQRANELFEGKRRQMKEDLEARERGGTTAGVKRPREEENGMAQEMRKLAEEGRKRRAARMSMMSENIKVDMPSSPAPATPRMATPSEPPKEPPKAATTSEKQSEEDEVERLERRIREATEAKAKRKAEKKSRKSGIFVPLDSDSPAVGSKAEEKRSKWADQDTTTPIKRPDIFKGLKADDKSSASPKFSFSPNTPKNDFSATMARLKAAEKQRLEEQIRQQESEAAN
ncbi:putative Pre-mRNA-splicing factor cwc23 [Halenospora varia]|nr:putative Pre-mRNA-splicing factor cwc23 [Halenospora varia]